MKTLFPASRTILRATPAVCSAALLAAPALSGLALAQTKGPSSSQTPYVLPIAGAVSTTSILTTGDTVPGAPGRPAYEMAGIPDGMGAFDNRNGTFTVLMNHELPAGTGVIREHGATGAFVSSLVVRKSDLTVVSGRDLIQNISTFDTTTNTYNAPAKGIELSRLCSADLAPAGALGTAGRMFFSGEEAGPEGRGFAHGLDGTSYQLPRLGRYSYENILVNPTPQQKTVVATTDDSGGGEVYVYIGTKSKSGSILERAGLTNGALFGVKVDGFPEEDPANGLPLPRRFSLARFGDVSATSGADLETRSAAAGVTSWLRPEDGAWDPNRNSDFYFVTTASFDGNSRLWRLRFDDIARPETGGTVEMMLDGTEGHKMLDNMCISNDGQIMIQEDPGTNEYLARVWRYQIGSGKFTPVAIHDPERFLTGGTKFLTINEESSGIVPLEDILGAGTYLLNVQAHYTTTASQVEGGQLLVMRYKRNLVDVQQNITPSPFTLPSSTTNELSISVRVENKGGATLRNARLTTNLPNSFTINGVFDTAGNAVPYTTLEGTVRVALGTLVSDEERSLVIRVAPQQAGDFTIVTSVTGTGDRNSMTGMRDRDTVQIKAATTTPSSSAENQKSAPSSDAKGKAAGASGNAS